MLCNNNIQKIVDLSSNNNLEFSMDPKTIKPVLKNAKTNVFITFENNRINVFWLNKKNDSKNKFETFEQEATNYYKQLFDLGIKAYRLAYNEHYDFTNIVNINEISSKVFKEFKFFKNKNIFEWGFKNVAKENVVISNKDENINIILHIDRAKRNYIIDNKIIIYDSLSIIHDINTEAINIDNKFNFESLVEFLEIKNTYIDILDKEIMEIIK